MPIQRCPNRAERSDAAKKNEKLRKNFRRRFGKDWKAMLSKAGECPMEMLPR